MFIDTHSKEGMYKSIGECFNIPQDVLLEKLDNIYHTSIDYAEQLVKLDKFIGDRAVVFPDEILLFHLSRRLAGSEDINISFNLRDLLINENKVSELLKNFGIVFILENSHIETIYNGKKIDWDRCDTNRANYLKSRLGFFDNRNDYCFNGFAFKDLLYKNNYARALKDTPEFIKTIADALCCEELKSYYLEHSIYFCFEYMLPISIVMFDDKEKLTLKEKQQYFIRCVLNRLIDYQTNDLKNMFDKNNPIIRLPDDYNLSSEYYVKKEKIDIEMLG